MPDIVLKDITMIYPFQKVSGLFDRKQKKLILEHQKQMPYTSNEGVIAVQHFDTTIKDKAFTVILGPSGSGKSTLLRIIAGLERPTLGEVWFDDTDYTDIRAEERVVAMVFQNYSLYPNQTVYQNIAFPLEVKHTPREEIDVEVKKISELLKLTNKLDRLPQDLSGGEKQRVAIARALIRRPSIVLFDEPFSNLDVLMRSHLRSEIKKIHDVYGTTFVYVTHDQYDALSLADRIIIINNGIKQMDDSISEVYNKPLNRFCFEFISSASANIFENVEVSKDRSFSLCGADYKLDQKQFKKLGKDRKMTVSIRGTNIEIGHSGIEAIVEYAEMIENDLYVHLVCQDQKLTVIEKTNNSDIIKYSRNQKVRIVFDEAHFHFFDQEGNRL